MQLDGPCRSFEHVLRRCRNVYFFSIIFHFYKERRGMGNTGANRDLKEQAHRHRRAHSTAKTPSAAFELLPVQLQQQRRRRRPGETRSCFSSEGAVGLCCPVLPHCLRLPTSHPPARPPARSEAPRAAGRVPDTQSFLLGARKAIGTARSWDAGLCAVPCPELDHRLKLGGFSW